MQIVRNIASLSVSPGGCVASIGNYDGVHLGHQAIISRLRREAERRGLPVVVLTFEPHPQDFFTGGKGPARIMGVGEKLECLAAEGVDGVVIVRFTRQLAGTRAGDFIDRFLVSGARVRYLAVGDDFRFGKGRAGDFALLTEYGRRHGFEVDHTETQVVDGERVSSSRIRARLAEGDLDTARLLLGRDFHISGHVTHGQRRGRTLGFPTANIHVADRKPVLSGVFAVHAVVAGGGRLPGVANIGLRPTVDGRRFSLEIHLLDFSGDLYGRKIRVEFLSRLREERRFESLDALKAAIGEDVDAAARYFRAADERRGRAIGAAGITRC